MEKDYCNEGCKYGLWRNSKEEKMAERTCKYCGKVSYYHTSDYIKNQILTQEWASNIIEELDKLSPGDGNIYKYLSDAVNKAINFVEKDKRSLVCNKLYEMLKSSVIYGEEAELTTCNIIKYIKADNISSDNFFEELDKFNIQLVNLNNMLIEKNTNYSR